MSFANTVGTVRYFQNLGQSYAEMFRGSLTAGGIVTAAAAWLGVGKAGAILIGTLSVLFWQLLAMLFGYIVWKWRIIHATMEHEWRNNPVASKTIDLLTQIEENTRR